MKEKGLPSRHDVQSQPTYEELQSNQSYLEEKIFWKTWFNKYSTVFTSIKRY